MKNFYDQQYFEKRDFLSPHLAKTLEYLMEKNNLKSVLDVGCGTGLLVSYLDKKGYRSIGCDNSESAVRSARKINKKGTIISASATKLPFAKNSFDLVTAISLVEHLTKRETLLFIDEAKRILTTGGFIFIVTPNYASPFRIIQGKKWFAWQDPTHINFYTPQKLTKIITKKGFGNIKCQFELKYKGNPNWEFPPKVAMLPNIIKKFLIYLSYSTPLYIIRNSFWLRAQKSQED